MVHTVGMDSNGVLQRHATEPPPDLPADLAWPVPQPIAELLWRMLAKSHDGRPQGCAEIWETLESAKISLDLGLDSDHRESQTPIMSLVSPTRMSVVFERVMTTAHSPSRALFSGSLFSLVVLGMDSSMVSISVPLTGPWIGATVPLTGP